MPHSELKISQEDGSRVWIVDKEDGRNYCYTYSLDTAQEVVRLHSENAKLRDALIGMVNQHCTYGDKLNSLALRDNADAMRLLEELGEIKIENGYGRALVGKWVNREAVEKLFRSA